MTVRGLFVSGDGRLRAPWRIALFFLAFLFFGVFASLVLRSPLAAIEAWSGIKDTGGEIAVTLAVLAAHVVMLKWIDRRPWSYVWLDRGAARGRTIGYGAVLGALPIASASLALLALGWLTITPAAPGSWPVSALRVMVLFLPAALFEELMSRGYVLAALRDWMGTPAAVGVSSAAFGLLHLLNPGAAAQPIIMVTLAGIFLAAVLLATKSLYAAWAAHFAWTRVMAAPFHAAVSGVSVPRPGYEAVDSGPDWATGGTWGPEGGAFAAAAMLAGMAWMYWRFRKSSTSKLQASTFVS